MQLSQEDFYSRFQQSLGHLKENYEFSSIHDAFIFWFGQNYLLLNEDELRKRIISDDRCEGVDAIFLDKKNLCFYFVQAKTVDKFDNTKKNFSEDTLRSVTNGLKFLLKGDYKGKITPEIQDLVDEYHELDKTGDYTTKVIFLFLQRNPEDRKFIDDFIQEFSAIKVELFNFERIYDCYQEYLLMRTPAPEKIAFEVTASYLVKEKPIKSYVFSCKASELARIYELHKDSIFERNVRYALGIKSKSINKQILNTATDERESKHFWYFNNGVTIISSQVVPTTNGRIINLKDPQIINGAQTTYAIYEAYQQGQLKEDIEIVVKAIESTERNFIENVTLYTNSQNPIRLRDLCSNDNVQRVIQNVLSSTYRHFYQRKRGEFEALYPTVEAKRETWGPEYKSKVIDNENSAQSYMSFYLDKPAQAKAEVARIFMKDESGFYDDIFNESDFLLSEKLLMSWKLGKYVESRKKEYQRECKEVGQKLEENRNIFKYDFLLHSEYYFLNILKSFLESRLESRKFNLSSKEDILEIITMIDQNSPILNSFYEEIRDSIADFMEGYKTRPGYYHNKFFKGDNINVIRNHMGTKFSFIQPL